ncbi:MAG: alpha/beta hydrolase [Bacillota bacterium]
MFDIINHKPKVNPLAEELFFETKSNNLAVLIHGFTGSTREMKELAQKIYDDLNFSVYVPRLPGHGTDSKDFQTTNRKDWLRKVYDFLINNQNNYENIHLIGLSMGALIAMLSSLHFKIKSLSLISPALYTTNKKILLTHIFKYITPVVNNDFIIDENIKDSNLIDLLENYSTKDFTKQSAELHKLMIECRIKLSKINTPTRIFHSKSDQMVPLKASKKIHQNIQSNDKDLTVYKNSSHVINLGPDREDMFDKIIEFLT